MTKRWLTGYPKNVPAEIDMRTYSSAVDILEKTCARYLGRPAFANMGTSISFSDLDRLSRQFAAYLQKVVGLRKGDRVAIQMPNCLQYPVVMFGALRAGCVVVNTNPLYTPREMEHQFKDSGAKAIVIMANFAASLEKVLPRTSIETVIVTELGDLLNWPMNLVTNVVVKHVKKMVPEYNIPHAVSLRETLLLGAARTFDRSVIESSDTAFLQYTGGTTGISKGAELTHANIVANMLQIFAWMEPKLREGQEIVITPLPLYHIFSLTVNCLALFSYGGCNVLVTNPRDLPAFMKIFRKHPFTVMTGVNTLFNSLLNYPAFAKLDFSHFKMAVGGGMAVQNGTAERWKKVTGTAIIEGYGLTESSPVIACNPLDDRERPGTIGMPLPSTEVRIIKEDGTEAGVGEAGELCARGPQIMKGYWQRPDETVNVLKDGWLYTGDVGVMLEDGFFKIVDRKKDMILVSGFNVYPNEVEDVVGLMPGVAEVAAIGVADDKGGEAVKIFVVRRDPQLTSEAIRDFCKQNLTGYKCPKHVEFRDELPKTNVGKILRRALKEESRPA
jgi:long-chain acyl-CoA synthetase